MKEISEIQITNEEVITHTEFEKTSRGFHGEARVIVTILVDGQTYTCEKVIQLSFSKS